MKGMYIMAFDGIVTSNIVAELNTCLIGGKINKVFEPNKNEVILGIYSHGVNYALNFSISSDSYRINLTTHAKPNPLNAPGFCMLLRKHLIGAKIKKIYTIGLERIVYIELECFNELNDLVNKKLIIELMGKHSNIILTNDNNMIIDSLRHLSIEEHSSRDILPAHEYSAPENTKIDFKSIKTFDEFYKLTSNLTNLDAGISKIFIGISKLYIQSIIEECNIDNAVTTSNLKTVYKYISETGNTAFLDEVIPFANKEEATVYEHLKRAVAFSLNHLEPHGMPAGLYADWNDCLRLGANGESSFVALQFYYAMTILKIFAEYKKDN